MVLLGLVARYCTLATIDRLMCPAVMAAVPGHPFIEKALRLVLERTELACKNPMGATGPRVILDAMKQWEGPAANDVPDDQYRYQYEISGVGHHCIAVQDKSFCIVQHSMGPIRTHHLRHGLKQATYPAVCKQAVPEI